MAKSMYKKVASHGSINVPVAYRREIGVQPGDGMEIELQDDNSILIKAYQPRCSFCGSKDNVTEYRNRGICPVCRTAIQKLTEE